MVFKGCFITTENMKVISWEAREKFDFCNVQNFKEPISMLGISCPTEDDLSYPYNEKDEIKISEQEELFKKELEEFSKKYPEATICFIEAFCAGETKRYLGYVLINGNKTLEVENGIIGAENLISLLKPLNIKLNTDGYFRPLADGGF